MLNSPLRSPLRPLLRAMRAGNSTPSVPSFYFNFSNPSNVTLGSAQARGTITSTQNAHITMSASLSRVVGVAPLYVNIDMTGTTSDLTTNATHDLFYSVNWGDSGAGQWANGVQSSGLTDKNWSFGPVGGHVFETPGTYLVTPTSTDGVNSASKPGYVTVLDPNVVYDPAYDSAANGYGHETICISHSNNFTGAPSGATQVNTAGNTDMYAAFNNIAVKSNKRILFCKADSWTISQQIAFTNITGTTLGGYGTGVARAFGSGTLVNVAAAANVNGSIFAAYTGCGDLRICDMKVLGGRKQKGMSLNNSITQVLAHKLEFRGMTAGFSFPPGNTGTAISFDQDCIYECVVDQLYGYIGVDTPRVASAAGAIGTPGIFTATGHPFQEGYVVQLTGTPPAPLATGTPYFISTTSLTANTFALSATDGGAALTLSGTGTCGVVCNGISGGIGAFVGLVRGGMMGCYIDSCNHGEQTLRVPFIDRGHINNNYIARPNQGKNIVKIHSFEYTNTYNVGPAFLQQCYSEKFVFAANVMDLRGGYSYTGPTVGTDVSEVGTPSVFAGNGGVSGDERVRNGIFESNYTYGCLGNPKNSMPMFHISCPNVTVRNNIYDASFGDRNSAFTGVDTHTYLCFVYVNSSTIDPTVGVRIYNNTLYSNIANAEIANFVYLSQPGIRAPVDTLLIKNNIWYLKGYLNASKGVLYQADAGKPATNVTATPNTDTASVATNTPNFTVTPPVALGDWKITSSSYGYLSGTAVPVLRDFNNASRVGTGNNMGAVLP